MASIRQVTTSPALTAGSVSIIEALASYIFKNGSVAPYATNNTYMKGDWIVDNSTSVIKLRVCNEDSVTGTYNAAKWTDVTFDFDRNRWNSSQLAKLTEEDGTPIYVSTNHAYNNVDKVVRSGVYDFNVDAIGNAPRNARGILIANMDSVGTGLGTQTFVTRSNEMFFRSRTTTGWTGWEQMATSASVATLALGGKFFDTEVATFANKKTASDVENPHNIRRTGGGSTPNVFTTLQSPISGQGGQFTSLTDAQFAQFVVPNDNSLASVSNTGINNMSQFVMSFNLIEHVQRTYGITVPGGTTANKVAWIKSNIGGVTFMWLGYGSGTGGSKATVRIWNAVSSSWTVPVSHTATAPTKLSMGVSTADIPTYVDLNGFIHFIAYAEPSDGTLASVIYNDYAELAVILSTDVLTNMVEATQTSKGLMSPSDKTKLDNAQQLKLANNDGTAITPPSNTNFEELSETGFYRYTTASGHVGGPTLTGTSYWLVTMEVFSSTAAVQMWKSANSYEFFIRLKTNGVWTPFRKVIEAYSLGNVVLGNKFTDKAPATFLSKSQNSITSNPHLAYKVANAVTPVTPVGLNSGFEMATAEYNKLVSANNDVFSSASISRSHHIFAFNLIEHVQRTYGIIPGANTVEKVAWLRANVVTLTYNWTGYGSAATGNKASFVRWAANASTWYGTGTHVNATPTRLNTATANMTEIESNGFVYAMAYAEPSDGAINSVIATDYVEVIVELSTDIKSNIPLVSSTNDGLMSKDDKVKFDASQQYRLTKNDGYINQEPNGADLNTYRKTGFYQFTDGTLNDPVGYMAGILEVYAVSDTYVIQEFTVNNSGAFLKFTRGLTNGAWTTWEKVNTATDIISTILGEPLVDRSVADFRGKVTGSTIANPHFAKKTAGGTLVTPVLTGEVVQNDYSALTVSDNTSVTTSTTTNLQIPQEQFSFNLIAHVEKTYFTIPGASTADKVAWLKANITTTLSWTGYGAYHGGNKATIYTWRNDTSTWVIGTQTSAGTPYNKVFQILDMTARIDSNGYLHILATTDPSNGSVMSVIYTDFIELFVDLKSDILSALPEATQSAKGLLSPTDKTKLDNAQQYKVTQNDGRLFEVPNKDANQLVGSNVAGMYVTRPDTKNLPDGLEVNDYHGFMTVFDRYAGSLQQTFQSYNGRKYHRYMLSGVPYTQGVGADTNGWIEYQQKPQMTQAILGGTHADLTTANFKKKVSGSTTLNPHLYQRTTGTTLKLPTDTWTENDDAALGTLVDINDVGYKSNSAMSGGYAQQMFSFNIVAQIERQYGVTLLGSTATLAEKIEWLQNNIYRLTANVYLKGSGPAGAQATLSVYSTSTGLWLPSGTGFASHKLTTHSKLTSISTSAKYRIDANGFAHYIAYAEPSDGTTFSELSVDYAELVIELRTTITNGLIVQKQPLTQDTGEGILATDFYNITKPGFYKVDGTIRNSPLGGEAVGYFAVLVTYNGGNLHAFAFDRITRIQYTSLFNAGVWSPWKRLIDNNTMGTVLFNNSFVDTTIASLSGKITGSNTANPHVIKASASTALVAPASFGAEVTQDRYDKMKKMDDVSWNISNTTNGNIIQVMVGFNVVEHIQRTYGTIPGVSTTEKAAWVRRNVSKFTFNSWAYGTNPTGNKLNVTRWNGTAWSGSMATHALGTLTKALYAFVPVPAEIDNAGMLYLMMYTDASNGTIASALNIAYAELLVELKTSMQENIPNATQAAAGLLSKEDKAILDNAQQKMLTKFDGGALVVANNTDFATMRDSGVYEYVGTKGHTGAPTSDTYWIMEIKEYTNADNVTQIWYNVLKDEVYSRRLNALEGMQFRREIDAKEVGGIIMNGKFNDKSHTTFATKVAGSVSAVPHIAKRSTASNVVGFTTLNAPDYNGYIEWSQDQYDAIRFNDGTTSSLSAPVGTFAVMAQHIFSFNIVDHIYKIYGGIPGTNLAERVTWVKDNLTKLTLLWSGFGSGAAGNKAYVNIYNVAGSVWHTNPVSHSNSTPTMLTMARTNANSPALVNFIDANGWVHYIAYAEAGSTTVQTKLSTDYVELQVEISTDMQNNLRKATQAIDGVMSKEDKAALDNAQKVKMTQDDGLAKTIPNKDPNQITVPGIYNVIQGTLNVPFEYGILRHENRYSTSMVQTLTAAGSVTSWIRYFNAGIWSEWRKSADTTNVVRAVLNDFYTDQVSSTFVGKVSGSVSANPHVIRGYGGVGLLKTTTPGMIERTQAQYNQMMYPDGDSYVNSASASGAQAQVLFSFNLIEYIQRTYGVIPSPSTNTAERVQWLKNNIAGLSFNWTGYGSSPAGNKASIDVYVANDRWDGYPTQTASTAPKRIQKYFASAASLDVIIQPDGYVHYIAYAEPSDGVGASEIYTDFVELVIDIKTKISTNLPRATQTADGLMTKEDKAILDNGQKYRLTEIDGQLKTIANNTTFADVVATGEYNMGIAAIDHPQPGYSGHLSVVRHAGSNIVKQEFTSYNTTGRVINKFVRNIVGGTIISPWKQQVDHNTLGLTVMGNDLVSASTANFMQKVTASTSANPHFAASKPRGSLEPPTNFSGGWETGNYSPITILDSTSVYTRTSTTNGDISQQIFSFNLLEHVQRTYGLIQQSDKVKWLRENISKLTLNWWGYGSSPAGNKAYIRRWDRTTSTWQDMNRWHTNAFVTLLTSSGSSNYGTYITDDGFFHILAYADASDGTTASTIVTDYVELQVEISTDIITNLPRATQTTDGVLTKEDKALLDSAQKTKFTEDDGTTKIPVINDLNAITREGFYTADVSTLNQPPGYSYGVVLHFMRYATNHTQIFMQNNSGVMFSRALLSGQWSPWRKSVDDFGFIGAMMGSKQLTYTVLNFANKTAGSTVNNANFIEVSTSAGLFAPNTFTVEATQSSYNALKDVGTGAIVTTNPTTGVYSQHMFAYNVIEHFQRTYGVIPGATTADKVAWLRASSSKITMNWWGYGSGPNGNKASLSFWFTTTGAWSTPATTVASTATKLANAISTSIGTAIRDDGFVYFLAYADASNGTIASTVTTGYAELVVEFSTDIKSNIPMAAPGTTDGLLSKEDKALLDGAQKYKLTQDNGRATMLNGSSFNLNDYTEPGFFYAQSNVSNLPLAGYAGYMSVTKADTSYCRQAFIAVIANKLRSYERLLINGVWSDWTQFSDNNSVMATFMGNTFMDQSRMNFAYKVAGSNTVIPHTFGRATTVSPALPPTGTLIENSQGDYDKIAKNDLTLLTQYTAVDAGKVPVQIFVFNMIAHVEKMYGTIPGTNTTDKVNWLKANVTKWVVNWYGRGTAPSSTRSTLALAVGGPTGTTSYDTLNTSTSTSVTRLSYTLNTTSFPYYLNPSGNMYVVAYSDAADATVPANIYTAYVEVIVDLTTDVKTNLPRATQTADGLMTKEDKAILDNGQKYRLTENNGRAKLLSSETDLNTLIEAGLYAGYTQVNGPLPGSSQWYYIEVLKHSDTYMSQKATRFAGDGESITYIRQMNSGTWGLWKRLTDNINLGSSLMGNKFNDRTLANFANKVAGSSTANPHVFSRASISSLVVLGSQIENAQSAYDNIKTLDGTYYGHTLSGNGQIAQQIFSFNLIEHIERTYGTIPGTTVSEKAAWIRSNVSRISFNWWGFGLSPTGNKATILTWMGNVATPAWSSTSVVHTNATTSKLSYAYSAMSSNVDSAGMTHFVVYAEPSNGTTNSTITTDYVELHVDLNTDIKSNLPMASDTKDGLMSKEDKFAMDRLQKYKLTQNDGYPMMPTETNFNLLTAPGKYRYTSPTTQFGSPIGGGYWSVDVDGYDTNNMFQTWRNVLASGVYHRRRNSDGVWKPFERSTMANEVVNLLLGNKFDDKTMMTFERKVSGSTTENPHSIRQNAYTSLLSPYVASPGMGGEFADSYYSKIMIPDGNSVVYSNSTSGYMVQQFYIFNVLDYVTRTYGEIPGTTTLDRVKWLRANIGGLIVRWTGSGSGATGNKATVSFWTNDQQWAYSPVTTTSATPTLITRAYDTSVPKVIDDTGMIYVIAYAEPSNGTIPSTLTTDHVEMSVNISTDLANGSGAVRMLTTTGNSKSTTSYGNDANKIFDSGFYATGPDTLNGPYDGSYGMIQHIRRHDGNFLQTWTNNIDSSTYTRAYHSDSVYWTSWKRSVDSNIIGTLLSGGVYPDISSSYYGNKTAGSLGGNANIAYADTSVSTPLAIGAFTTELTTNQYKQIAVDSTDPLITTTPVTTAGVTGKIAQQLFAFDLIGHFNKLYGTTPGLSVADKVVWLKRAVNKLTFKWSGRATGTTAKATINRWSTTTNSWASGTAHSNTQQTTLSLSATGTLVAPYITATGHVYFIAYSDTATTTAGATLTTNFAELDVELNLDMATTTRPIWIDLPLKNNWGAYPKDSFTNTTQTPQYTLSKDGWVSFRGALSRSGTSEWWSTLPAEIRPARDILFPAPTNSKTMGRIFIRPSGEAHAYTAYDVDGTNAWLLDLNSVRYNIYE